MPAVTVEQIDWSGIRANAMHVGIREAARQAAANLPPIEQERFVYRVLRRASRQQWLIKAKASTALAASSSPGLSTQGMSKPLSANVLNGSDSIAKTLAEDSNQTKIGFSAAARKVAHKIASLEPNLDKDRAQAVRHWAGVASTVHGWSEEKGGDRRVMINIGILNE